MKKVGVGKEGWPGKTRKAEALMFRQRIVGQETAVQTHFAIWRSMMIQTIRHLRTLAALAVAGVVLVGWPAAAMAQTVSGSASAVQANALGMTTTLAGTGPLADPLDLREASELSAAILSLGSADVMHAATGSSITDWSSEDYVASEASLADLALSVAGNSISAGFVMSRALAPVGGSPLGTSEVDGLAINGMNVAVTGAPNQTIWLLGGQVVINEQVPTATGTTVNALHVIVDGVADLVIASASAAVTPDSSTSTSPLPRLF